MTHQDLTKQEYATWREWFKVIFKHFTAKDCRFIWIDEVSFNTRKVKPYSWVSKYHPTPVQGYTKQNYSTAICALTDHGEFYSKMRVGINTAETFVEFLEELEEVLRDRH